ncbi:MAG: NAD(P)/FAD-dependent oxidoreductase, partial [Anaerolineae bacterium]|nr:NAD(P)/FAD-dependent oxidoreductase [Anaerolineae bacterium]
MNSPMYDVLIIGAGVVGSLIARTLSRYRLRILLLDKASDVGEGTTKANTAIIHAGYDAKPGTLKAKLNVAGNPLFDQLCAELDVPFERCGTYVIALSEKDRHTLRELYERGKKNNVPKMHLISGQALRQREPAVNALAVEALYAETGGMVDPFELCIGAAENAVMNGVELLLETKALDFIRQGDRIRGVLTTRGPFYARWTIIAAGLWADDLLHKAGLNDFHITPRKGEYFVLDKAAAEQVHGILFPCPTPISKGILVTRTIHGNVLLGPNAQNITDKKDLSTTSAGLEEVMAGALKLVPSLDRRHIIRTFAGLRASGSTGDFLIEAPKETPGLIVLAGIESPGLTASPAIAEYVVEMLREAGLTLEERPDYNPIRKGIPRFAQLSPQERQALIAQDPRFGHIVCRCEMVTEGEIVAACHRPIPARTYDAIKRRTRLG